MAIEMTFRSLHSISNCFRNKHDLRLSPRFTSQWQPLGLSATNDSASAWRRFETCSRSYLPINRINNWNEHSIRYKTRIPITWVSPSFIRFSDQKNARSSYSFYWPEDETRLQVSKRRHAEAESFAAERPRNCQFIMNIQRGKERITVTSFCSESKSSSSATDVLIG